MQGVFTFIQHELGYFNMKYASTSNVTKGKLATVHNSQKSIVSRKVSQNNYCIKNLDGQERSSRKNHVGFTIDSSYTRVRIINSRNGVQASVKNL